MASPTQKPSGFENLPVVAKVLLLGMVLLVVTAVYYLAFHMSLADDISSSETRYVRLQADMEEAQQERREFLEVTQELASREAIDRQNKRVLPDKAEIAAFLEDLNRRAELSGLDIRLVEPRPEEQEDLYIRIPVTLQLSGRFHEVAKFFYQVSRLERAINMENVTLTDPEVTGEEVMLTIDVLATTFRRPGGEEDGAAE